MSRLDEIKKKLKNNNNVSGEQDAGTEQSTGMSRLQKIKQQVNGKKTSTVSVPTDLEDLINDYTSYMNDAKTLSESIAYGNAESNFVSINERSNALYKKIEDLEVKYNLNKEDLTEQEQELKNYLTRIRYSSQDANTVFYEAFKYYKQWETEEDYNNDVAANEEYQKKANLNLDEYQKEIDKVQGYINEYTAEMDGIKSSLGNEAYLVNYSSADLKKILNSSTSSSELKEKAEKAIEYKQLETGLGGFESQLRNDNVYLKEAKKIQEGLKLAGVADPNSEYYDPEFYNYDDYKSTYTDDPKDKVLTAGTLGYKDLTYEFINGNMRSTILALAGGEEYTSTVTISEYTTLSYMNDDEVAVYNYYYSKYGKEKAEEYLDSIRQTLAVREAHGMYESVKDDWLATAIFAVGAGVDQFEQGIANLFMEVSPSATQMASGMLREDLEDSWWGGLGYDLLNTTGNMLPSILVSTIPVVGQVAGTALMGASAAGNAKAEMINLGYSKEQAYAYGALVGASEAGLQYLLGGISSLGGKASGGLTKIALSKVDNALARVAIQLGGSMLSEGIEEGLQTILEPWFKSIVTGVDFEAPNVDEVLYSSLLGALSAGLLEGGGTVAGEVSVYNQGKNALAQGIDVNKLASYGTDTKFFSADSVAYRLAGKVNEKTGAYTIARLFNEMNAQLTTQNQADIIRSLERKGVASKDAKTIATALAQVVAGEQLTEKQVKALDSNPVVAQTMQDVIINKNSTVNQRLKGFAEATQTKASTVAQETTGQAEATAQTENAPVEQSAEIEAENVSDSGKTVNKTTGEEVNIQKVTETKGGLKVELDNGMVVSASDLSYSTKEEALMYEMAARMEASPTSTNAMLNAFKPSSYNEASLYYVGVPLAYQYGKIGYEAGLKSIKLSQKAKQLAYKLGREDAQANAISKDNARATEPQKAKSATIETKAESKSIIYENGFTYDESKASDIQKVSMAYIDVISKMTSVEVHVFESKVVDGKRMAMVNGKLVPAPNGYFQNGNQIYIDINAGNNGEGAMLLTMGHEITHFIRRWNEQGFKELGDFLLEQYGKAGVSVERLLELQRKKIKNRYESEGKALPSEATLNDIAYEELVADAMSDMLADPKAYEKLATLKQKNLTLWQKVGEAIKSVLKKLGKALRIYKDAPVAREAYYVRDFAPEVYEKLQDLYIKAFAEADANYEASIGSRNLNDFAEALDENGEPLFQYKAMEADEEQYRHMLHKWGKMSAVEIDNLFDTIDNAMELIKANLEALDYAWEADIDDRSFSPIKKNTDKLYKVSVDFSTLCRKRLLQQTIQGKLQEALDRSLTKEEGIAIRDALMAIQEEGRQIEIACALCYVESARMKSHNQIKKFLNNREDVLKNFFASKSGGDIKSRIKQAEAKARERLGVGNTPLTRLPANAAKEIRDAKKKAKASYVPSSKEAELIEIAKGMTVNDFATPAGLENLAKNYPELFDAYASFIVNATHAKGIENDTWWRAGDSYARNKSGDINISDTLIDNMNRENGLRSQSWSDFQVIHLLDYIAATIELSTRNSKEQIYTKVPDFVDLMGLTNAMLNMSLIPTREFNGSLEYDAVEGMPYDMAVKLREAYPNTAGTICIGIDNEQIRMLLADIIIDYVIPYHRSGMSAHTRKAMHLPTWSEYEDYQSEKNLSRAEAEKQAKKYGVKLLDASDPNYQKGTSFSEWFDLREAQQITKMENAHPTDKAKQKKYGVMYGGYMAMQNAANNYLKLCAERGLAPKFSHENANFTTEENYWKLLIDRKMVNNATGEIIEQQSLKPIFSEEKILRILNDELERYPKVKADQEYAIRRVTEKMLSGEIKGGMSAKAIADVMKKPVDNVAKVNILASSEDMKLSGRDSDPYSYEALISKPDMKVTLVDDSVKYNRADIVYHALKNATSVGRTNQNGNAVIHVDDIDKDIIVPKRSLVHGLDRRTETQAPVLVKIGDVLKNSIRINELIPRADDVKSTYVLIGIAQSQEGNPYLASFVVNKYSNEVTEIDVLYSANAKKESAALLPKITDKSATPTDSKISIAQLLKFVNKYFPDILPEQVLRHFGYDARPEGKLGESALYSDRDDLNQIKSDLKKYNVDPRRVTALADSYLENYGGVLNKTQFHLQFYTITEALAEASTTGNAEALERADRELKGLADEIVTSPKAVGTMASDINAIKKHLKGVRIKIPKFNKGDFDAIGGFENFRKRHMGKLLLANNGLDIDTLYPELQELFGTGYFPDNITHVADQLMKIAEVIDTPIKAEMNYDVDEAREYLVSELSDKIANIVLKKDDFNYRNTELISNRSLLANALEGVAQNDIEKNKLKQYKDKIALIESEQAKLTEIRAKANELRFTKGRTQAETKTMRELDAKATQIANRISTYDKQLLNLEATTALKNVLQREKELLRRRERQKGYDALRAYKERSLKAQNQIISHYQESRKKTMENRYKTEMRHKIKKVVGDLNKLLLHGTKERNIKLGLQEAVALALEAINMDTVSADARIAKLREELMKANTPEKIEEIQHKIDYIKNQGDNMSDKLEALRKAYRDIRNSTGKDVSSQFKEEATLIENKIESVISKVGSTPLRDMSLSQLEQVYDLYKMVLTTVRNANGIWRQGKLEDLQQNASKVMEEIDKHPKMKSEGSKLRQIIRKFKWNEMTPYYAFDNIGSETLKKLFYDFVEAQNVYGRDVKEVKEFASSTRSKYGYGKWNLDKMYEFQLKDGRVFSTTLKHLMSIYAYSKRDQALAHMSQGGFFHNDNKTFRKKGGVLEMVRTDDVGYKIDSDVLAEIKEALTKEQIAYVDEMQEYLTKMGEKGNEVTRVMWGIDIFKEKVYFPLKSKNDFIKSSTETAQSVSLKNDGMTKETVPGASNPIVLEAFDDVWAAHTERMSQYHAFVIPIDNMNKVHQYGTWAGTESTSVSTMLAGRFGNAVNEYITQFIKDMNGAVVTQGVTNPIAGFFSKFKKTAVGMSLSTIVQQPTAIVRAMSVVDAKHFVGKPNLSKLSTRWAELQSYAPIAIIKEIGGFDAGSGTQVTQWINSDTARGIDKVMNVIDDVSMKGAELADQIGWVTIWEAVKRETKATTNLEVGSEAFLKKAGERFTEVIVQTQVYDSTLSRSAFMRSKNDGVKMLTSFMGEPTLAINMMYNAVVNAMRGGSKLKAAKTIGLVYASSILASAFASAIYALNDDDEDESYWEKYMQAFGGEVISDIVLLPINSLPVLRDIVSIFQGWDVERTDMSIFKDIYDSFTSLDSENKSTYRKIEDFAGAIGSIFGLPVKNLLKTGRQLYNLGENIFDDIEGGDLGDAFVEGVTGDEKSKSQKLYEAIINGDTARLEVLKKGYKNDEAYEQAIRKALKEYDSRIQEAAQAIYEGDVEEYSRIFNEILEEGNFELETIKGAINSAVNDLKPEEDSASDGANKVESMYETNHYYLALLDGDTYTASKVKEDIINTAIANGKSRDEAEESFTSSLKSNIRDGFADGTLTRSEAMNMLISYADMDSDDAYWQMKKYDYYVENGSYDGYSKYDGFYEAVRTGISLKAVINEYTSHGVEAKTLASQITSYFKPLYINMTNSERAGIKGYLLNAYAQLGYNRAEKSKDIDNWLK